MSVKLKVVTALLVIIGVLSAAHVLYWDRYTLEKEFKSVELVMNYGDVINISSLTGRPEREVLAELKDMGLTTVLFKEMTIDDIERYEAVTIYSKNEIMLQLYTNNLPNKEQWEEILKNDDEYLLNQAENSMINQYCGNVTYFICNERDIFDRLYLQLKTKVARVDRFFLDENLYVISVSVSRPVLKQIGLGFPKRHIISNVENNGLNTMVQVRSWPNADAEDFSKVFGEIKQIKSISGILFNNHIIVGTNEDILKELADEIKNLNVPLVAVEFFNQKGFNALARMIDKNVARLHTISPNVMFRYTPHTALERYELAVLERNHRVLLIRPFSAYMGADALEVNSKFLKQLKERLESRGFYIGRASTLEDTGANKIATFLTGLGVIAGAAMLFLKLFAGNFTSIKRRETVTLLLIMGSAVIWAILLFASFDAARKLMALISAMVFPTTAIVLFVNREKISAAKCVQKFFVITIYSFIGAVFLAGLLVGTEFMLKLNQFVGVKIAHLLPLIIITFIFAYRGTRGADVYEKLYNLWNKPLVLGASLLGIFIMTALFIYLLRTGNEGMTLSNLEVQMRSMLDALMGVRPRTKEFLIGHPAMLVLLYYGYRDNWYLPLVLMGAVGQVSLVNTFAHLHTPLVVSLERMVNGLILGVVIGLLAIVVINLVKRRLQIVIKKLEMQKLKNFD